MLPGYQTYATAFQIAQQATGGKVKAADPGEEPQDDSVLVDESAAVKGLMKWVKLHPTNIGQKVRIIVEHFRSNVAGLLDGHGSGTPLDALSAEKSWRCSARMSPLSSGCTTS